MTCHIAWQNVSKGCDYPPMDVIGQWVDTAIDGRLSSVELGVRLVAEEESCMLNRHYRGVERSTNILSFPADLPYSVEPVWLGDLVICPAVIEREADEQNKSMQAHWAHMVVHGTLHLLGYDHQENVQAQLMEGLEIRILHRLNFPNPYHVSMEGHCQYYE